MATVSWSLVPSTLGVPVVEGLREATGCCLPDDVLVFFPFSHCPLLRRDAVDPSAVRGASCSLLLQITLPCVCLLAVAAIRGPSKVR